LAFQKICVLGLGYIGLPTACTFATHGLQVIGVDVNPEVVETIKNGGLHIHEPGLKQLVDQAVASGNFQVSLQPQPADAFLITVPTPFTSEKQADLSYVISAAESILPHLKPGSLVILESTSPPRTTVDVVAPILARSGLRPGHDFFLAYSPERVLPGKIIEELVQNARVVGGVDPGSSQAGRDLYLNFVQGEIYLTDATTAEMVKLMENTYRDVNIALANEFSHLAGQQGVDIWEAVNLANRHPRVNILNPGPGVGGHCISVDPWFLVETDPQLAPLISTARQVNDQQPQFVVDLVQHALGSLSGRRIAALGLAYKPDVDDLRESPAIAVAQGLAAAGAEISTYEPFKPNAQVPGIQAAQNLADAIQNADLLLLLVGHTEFKNLDPQVIASQTTARIVVDTVNGWDAASWRSAGFQVVRLGDGAHKPVPA